MWLLLSTPYVLVFNRLSSCFRTSISTNKAVWFLTCRLSLIRQATTFYPCPALAGSPKTAYAAATLNYEKAPLLYGQSAI